jgi:hypothetical protein
VVICQTGVGRFYYKGVGLQNGLSVEIDDPVQTGATFVPTNNGVQYSLPPTALIITQGSTVLRTSRCWSTGLPNREGGGASVGTGCQVMYRVSD